jgi:GntR family transcriptional repressor for pyruvate dehydrogenase complex
MLRTTEDYAARIKLHTTTLAALKRGAPVQIEEEMYRHLGHFEGSSSTRCNAPHRQMPAFLLAGTH